MYPVVKHYLMVKVDTIEYHKTPYLLVKIFPFSSKPSYSVKFVNI